MVLSDLALVATHRPDQADTAALFLESLAEWRKVGNVEGLVDWLPFVATLTITSQQHELGVWLLTAAERAADTIGYRFEPAERGRQQQLLNTARSFLGEPAFTVALAEGRRLTLEPAVTAATEFLIALHERAIAAAAQGQSPPYGLTPREIEVLRLLIDGRTDRQIGEILCISHRTAMRHVEHILTKLEVDSRTAAATQAVRLGLV
jgi:DNA-binding CsgD family transcriptional regulator